MRFLDLLPSLECHKGKGIHFPILFSVSVPERDSPVFLQTLRKYPASIKKMLVAGDTVKDRKPVISCQIFFCHRDTGQEVQQTIPDVQK